MIKQKEMTDEIIGNRHRKSNESSYSKLQRDDRDSFFQPIERLSTPTSKKKDKAPGLSSTVSQTSKEDIHDDEDTLEVLHLEKSTSSSEISKSSSYAFPDTPHRSPQRPRKIG